MKICPNCETEFKEGSFCVRCGTPLIDKIIPVHCSQCGTLLPAGAKFCHMCATPVGGRPTSNPSTSSTPEVLTFTVNGVSFDMIKVEHGTFKMGSDDGEDNEKPVHSVTLTNDYYIGKYQVTQALWKAVMGENPSKFKGDDLPVECVSWHDIRYFTIKLNQVTGKRFRLPSEAEWEYAARGGNRSRGDSYSGSYEIEDVAWYFGNSDNKTHSVGLLYPNELGICDMSGNVWEWCQDCYGPYPSGAQTNPTGASSGSSRVNRGGCWGGRNAGRCRVSARGYDTPDVRSYYVGFRLAL